MGLTHLDAGVLIGLLNSNDAHHMSAGSALAECLESGHRLGLSASGLTECLVAPSRAGPQAVATVLELCARLPIEVVPLDVHIATRAADLRARHTTLRLPDALVIATAYHCDADRLLTTDRRWPSPEQLGAGPAIVIL